MKPGPATSKRSNRLPSSCSFAVMASAIWRGCLVERARTGHGHVGCNIAVFDVSRDLDDEVGQCGLGQGTVGDGCLDGVGQQRARLCQRRRTGL